MSIPGLGWCVGVLFMASPASAAWSDSSSAAYSYGEFLRGSVAVWHRAGVLAGPGSGEDTVSAMPRGACLEIVGGPEGLVGWRGIGTPWYPVRLTDGSQGWIAGTDLALSCACLSEDVLVLFALTGRDTERFCGFEGAALAVRSDGTLADSIPIALPSALDESPEGGTYRYCVGFGEADPAGLEGLSAAVVLVLGYEACGYLNVDQLIGWNGEELIPGPAAARVSEAGIFHHHEWLVMPSDPGGSPGSISVAWQDEEWDEDAGGYSAVASDTTVFIWNGASFEEEQ